MRNWFLVTILFEPHYVAKNMNRLYTKTLAILQTVGYHVQKWKGELLEAYLSLNCYNFPLREKNINTALKYSSNEIFAYSFLAESARGHKGGGAKF